VLVENCYDTYETQSGTKGEVVVTDYFKITFQYLHSGTEEKYIQSEYPTPGFNSWIFRMELRCFIAGTRPYSLFSVVLILHFNIIFTACVRLDSIVRDK
jgi:hypothetical protein